MNRIAWAVLHVVIGTALAPCILGQAKEKPVKINDAVSMVPATGNVYLVTTPAGDVVIDTAMAEIAGEVKKIFDSEPHGPIKYIILTHAHADHIGGISLWKEPDTQIIAQRNYVEFVHYVARLEGFFAPHNAAAFNRASPSVGPWAGNFGGALEDKIVQKAVVDLLNAIYEQDFLDCSYGFRPKRSQHQALDKIDRIICTRPIAWVLEIDIRSYFDSIVRSALVGMIEKRVIDGSVLRLIGKWIKVGVIEDGRLLVSETGTGQGQPISPLLANIYLHSVLSKLAEHPVSGW